MGPGGPGVRKHRVEPTDEEILHRSPGFVDQALDGRLVDPEIVQVTMSDLVNLRASFRQDQNIEVIIRQSDSLDAVPNDGVGDGGRHGSCLLNRQSIYHTRAYCSGPPYSRIL